MAARFTSNTVRSVGALLPSDVLAKALAGAGLDGLDDSDYGVPEESRLRDVVNDAWNEARSLWWRFQTELRNLPAEDQAATSLTREKWLLPLLGLLGFDDIKVEKRSPTVSGTEYPISHRWKDTPLHLVGARVDLDGRVAGIPGAARLSPHSLLQQYLNRSDDHLWGIVTDGRRLRILRDSVSLTRQAFVEFDLEALFNGEVFPDFILLYRIVHATRFDAERPEECLLERWIAAARDEGIRALDQLRDGVQEAIVSLGTGFLKHPDNESVRSLVESGDLKESDLYRYLLRLVYRLLFLFVSEDRDLLLLPGTSPEVRARHSDYYSSHRLRELASVPTASGQSDMWAGLVALMGILGRDEGEPGLGLPGLGSFLWDPSAIGPLVDASIDNADIGSALQRLSYVRDGGSLRRIDFAGLGAEELGSVYESLLELHPKIDLSERAFTLGEGGGSERKATGSYYTPTELISELLDSALDPVLDEAASKPDPEAAILDLKVVDPAAGSGHFLVAAAHRIAKRLAEMRTGEPEPPEDAYRTAVRDVVSRCIYAVDMNDLAVELCKVSLWLEALEPGKPLSFLDHHILRGNSLFGATPAAIAAGIPDDAFGVLTGDDKATVSYLKKRNTKERAGQQGLDFDKSDGQLLGVQMSKLEEVDDDDLGGVRTKEELLAEWKQSEEYRHAVLVANAWCASFTMKKAPESLHLTEAVFRSLRDDNKVVQDLAHEIEVVAERHGFFHWHLEFPRVFSVSEKAASRTGWAGGFDVVLGNPPWERVKLQEKEFFASKAPGIAEAPNKAARQRLIKRLPEDDPELWSEFQGAVRDSESVSHFLRRSNVFPLCGRGDVNTYAVFAELMRSVCGPVGRVGVILPTGIATDATTQHFFSDLVDSKSLASLFDFENRKAIFPGVHRSYKFSLITLSGSDRPIDEAEFCFFALSTAELGDEERRFTLTADDFALLNPNTKTCPTFRSRRDAQITKEIYRRVPVLIQERSKNGNPLRIEFLRMFDMSNDSGLFRTREELVNDGWVLELNQFTKGGKRHIPLYEAKMVSHFDHRFSTYSEGEFRRPSISQIHNPEFLVLPRYWVSASRVRERLGGSDESRLIGWRNIARSTDVRTLIGFQIPLVATNNSILLVRVSQRHFDAIQALLSSFALDYVARQKVGGSNFTYNYFRQLPLDHEWVSDGFPTPWPSSGSLSEWIGDRVCELRETSVDFHVRPFKWDIQRRSELRAELDALFFHLYGVPREDLEYIMETFPIVKRQDIQEHGVFRTRDLVLEIYDQMSVAIESEEPYQTNLDPAPADPSLRIDVEATA